MVDDSMEGKWFKIWFEYKQLILSEMYQNISDDLNVGYNPFGTSILNQRRTIDDYIRSFDEEMDHIKEKSKQQVEHWCYYDLKKRGAIA